MKYTLVLMVTHVFAFRFCIVVFAVYTQTLSLLCWHTMCSGCCNEMSIQKNVVVSTTTSSHGGSLPDL